MQEILKEATPQISNQLLAATVRFLFTEVDEQNGQLISDVVKTKCDVSQ